MPFNSFEFLILVAVTFILYYLTILKNYQIQLLIISSLLFYAFDQPILVLLLLFSVAINIVSSYIVVYGHKKNQKLAAYLGVILNLSILFFFKYGGLLANTLLPESSFGSFLIKLPLPIGISFFTFQGISLVVDVYRNEKIKNTEVVPISFWLHVKRVLFFKAFFPQLISGPIVKAHEFMPQIERKFLNKIDLELCFKYLATGYFLKMVVADNLKDFTYWIAFPYFQTFSTATLISMLFGYSFQIFADFAGYSLIAIGLARLFGYKFNENFNFPYISVSFKEFWKRWHISLSSFLMQYLYIPLGGNKKGKIRTYINLLLTMTLGGLWHGAAWSYAIWGFAHGYVLATERMLTISTPHQYSRLFLFVKGLFVFSFVTFAWLLFKLPDFKNVIDYVLSTLNNYNKPNDIRIISCILIYSSPVLFYHGYYILKKYTSINIQKLKFIIYGTMLFLIVTNSGSPGSFIYFQF